MLLKKIVNILRNIFYLFISSRHKKVNWSFIAEVKVESEVSTKAYLNAPCHLNNATIGDYSYTAQNAWITYTNIGKFCSIGPNFFCGWGVHPINGISTSPMFYSTRKQNGTTLVDENKIVERKYISIGNDVFIGANVTILDGVTIGHGAIVGANSLVNSDIAPYAIVAGVPAKILKYRFAPDQIVNLLNIKWWDWEFEKLFEIEKCFFDIEEFLRNNNR